MGCCIRGTAVPTLWRRLLLVCFLFAWTDAAQLMRFSGSIICLDSGVQIKKPKDVNQSVWQTLRVVDSSGIEVDDCQFLPDGSLLTVPERCINHKAGRRVVHISLNDSMEDIVYLISCNDEQADSAMGTTINCKPQYMMVTIPRTLEGFDDETASALPPPSEWTIEINNGTSVKVNVRTANRLGYTLTSDDINIVIYVNYDAFGIKKHTFKDQDFYSGDLVLIHERRNPRITVDVKIACARGPPSCNETHMTLAIPSLAGVLDYILLGSKKVPLTISSLRQQGMTLDTRGGTHLSISVDKLKVDKLSGSTFYSLPDLTLILDVNELMVSMTLTPTCSVGKDTARKAICTRDGFMIIEVFTNDTVPNLDLRTVTVKDRTCQPEERTSTKISFRFPVNSCGTTKQDVGGMIFYENEVSALWKNLPPRSISRDSELRETVRCYYNGSDLQAVNMTVNTLPPPASTRHDGPILFMMNIYPDVSYQVPYSDDQYPVVKTLQDPIFLEVQVLNRNDPNIELVLNDCWATMSQDPNALPQWNIVVDGCQANEDNYLTIFHPVEVNVPQATHRKRFEVKAFAFMQDGELSTNMVYFHCSAIVCNINSPDYPLCTKSCLSIRSKRDELFLHRHSNLASLPGPVLLLDSEPSSLEDERDIIKQVTIGVLPAFALVAVIGLVVLLINFIHKSKL